MDYGYKKEWHSKRKKDVIFSFFEGVCVKFSEITDNTSLKQNNLYPLIYYRFSPPF